MTIKKAKGKLTGVGVLVGEESANTYIEVNGKRIYIENDEIINIEVSK